MRKLSGLLVAGGLLMGSAALAQAKPAAPTATAQEKQEKGDRSCGCCRQGQDSAPKPEQGTGQRR
jgi:hypothetical protein